MLKRWLSLGLITLLIGLGGGGVAHAATASDPNEVADYNDALSKAPIGISLDQANQIISIGTAADSVAKIVDANNANSAGTQVLVMTTDPMQFGSAWSTDDNKFDLTHDETMSAWIYLGNRGGGAGDGMAFVLQNDPSGIAAVPQFPSTGPIGETLGAFAVDDDSSQSSTTNLAKTAIQNSWALGFDTYPNTLSGTSAAGSAGAFDESYNYPTIFSNYPGDPSAYTQQFYRTGLFGTGKTYYYYNLVHEGLLKGTTDSNFLSNGLWHHLTLKYVKTPGQQAGTMTYSFDDEDPDTGTAQPGQSATVPLDLTKIDPNNTGYARWGFTANTGGNYENNMIDFENTPGLVDGHAGATITDLTQNKPVTTDSQVIGGDQLQLDYNLNYDGGRQNWSSIVAHLNLPSYLHYGTAEIVYNDKTVPLDPDDIDSNNKLTTSLDETLSSTNPTATIRFTGVTNTVPTTQYVDPVNSIFSSNALVTSADTPGFAINPQTNVDLTVTSDNPVTLPAKQDTTVTGIVSVATTSLSLPDVKVQANLNGTDLPDVAVGADGSFSLPLTADQLQLGTNLLKLTGATVNGDTSKTITVPITVVGTLGFTTVASDSGFQTTTLTGSNQLVGRNDDWDVEVQDTRGTGNQWVLDATASDFVDPTTGAQLDGYPVYVNAYGSTPLNTVMTQIMSHTTDDSVNDGTTNVTADWTPNTGILLNVGAGTPAGNYQGTITWTLSDAPA